MQIYCLSHLNFLYFDQQLDGLTANKDKPQTKKIDKYLHASVIETIREKNNRMKE